MRAKTIVSARSGRHQLAPWAATEWQGSGVAATGTVSRPASRSTSSTHAAVGSTGASRRGGSAGVVAVVVAEEQKETRCGAVLADDGVDGSHGDCPHERLNVTSRLRGGGYDTLTCHQHSE
jgi:hypothetical protein